VDRLPVPASRKGCLTTDRRGSSSPRGPRPLAGCSGGLGASGCSQSRQNSLRWAFERDRRPPSRSENWRRRVAGCGRAAACPGAAGRETCLASGAASCGWGPAGRGESRPCGGRGSRCWAPCAGARAARPGSPSAL